MTFFSPVGWVERSVTHRCDFVGYVAALRNPRYVSVSHPRFRAAPGMCTHWAQIVLWMNLRGYGVALEPIADWIARVERASRDATHVLHRLRGFLLKRSEGEGGRTLAEIYADPAVARLDAARSDALVAGLGLQCLRVSSATWSA